MKACEKRPVSTQTLEEITDRIERACHERFDREVDSKFLGALVMQEMRQIDQVAYVRFASVYREFKDVAQFLEELKPMLEKPGAAEAGETPAARAHEPRAGEAHRAERAEHKPQGAKEGRSA